MTRTDRYVAFPYTPEQWTPEQAQAHQADDLDVALHQASCLAGGWYRRPCTVYMRIVHVDQLGTDAPVFTWTYRIRPSDAPCDAPWRPVYQVAAYNDDGTVRQ